MIKAKVDKSIKYVVGIDFGHGETAAAVCSIDWDKKIDNLKIPEAVEILPGVKVIQSVIGYDTDGRILIGDEAILGIRDKSTRPSIGWKKRPSIMNDQERKMCIDFMAEVYKKIRLQCTNLTGSNHCVYIGHPSGWGKEEINLYAEMAREAGLINANMTKESRAALKIARMKCGTEDLSDKGVLVCDFGSSTLDFTYCLGLINEDDGADLGASLIDKMILEQAINLLDNSDKNKTLDIFNFHHGEKVKSELKCREIKEKYFQKNGAIPIIDDVTIGERPNKVHIEVEITEKILNSLVGVRDSNNTGHQISVKIGKNNEIKTGTWRSLLRESLTHVKKYLIKRNSLSKVLLTGGASRMSFISEDIQEILRIGNEDIKKDNDPSLTIALGITDVGRSDLRSIPLVERCKSELYPTIDIIFKNKIYDFIYSTSNLTAKFMISNLIFPTLLRWRNGEIATLEDVNKIINSSSSEIINDSSYIDEVKELIKIWITERINSSIIPEIEKILCEFGYSGNVLTLNIDDKFSIFYDYNINLDFDSINLGNTINWGGVLAAFLMGFFLGPLWGLLSIFFPIFKSNNKIDLTTNYPLEDRKKIYFKIEEEEEKILSEISESIFTKLSKNEEFTDWAIAIGKKYACAHIEKEIQTARLLID